MILVVSLKSLVNISLLAWAGVLVLLFSENLLQAKNNYTDTLYADEYIHSDLHDYLDYYRTPVKDLSLDSVKKYYESGCFLPWKRDRFKQFYNDDQYWFGFTVGNDTDVPHDLLLGLAGRGYTLTLYEYKDGGWIQLDSSSIHTPLNQRTFQFRNLTIPVLIEPHTTQRFFLKLQKTIVRHAVFDLKLGTYQLFLESELKEFIWIFFYVGFFLFAILFSLLLYYFFREKVHLYQSFYIFFAIIFSVYTFNLYGYFLRGKAFVVFSSIPTPLILFLCVIVFLFVFRKILETWQYPIIDRLLKVIIVLSCTTVLCSICSYILYFQLPASEFRSIDNLLRIPTFLIFFIYTSGILISIFYLFGKVRKELRFFLAAIFLSMVFWTFSFIEFAGAAELNFIPPNNLIVCHSIEILTFMLLSIYKFWNDRNEKLRLLEKELILQQKLVEVTVEAQESERKRIAQELHDGLGGYLSALRMMVNRKKNKYSEQGEANSAASFTDIQDKLDKAIKDVREISHNLMPSDFETKDFSNILKEYIHYLNENGTIAFEYFVDERINSCDKIILISLYRITTELIRNMQKHSGATGATIQLIMHEDVVQLQVEDNGKGMEMSQSDGIGLNSIRSRIQYLQGRLTIDSGASGTTFIIEIPVI